MFIQAKLKQQNFQKDIMNIQPKSISILKTTKNIIITFQYLMFTQIQHSFINTNNGGWKNRWIIFFYLYTIYHKPYYSRLLFFFIQKLLFYIFYLALISPIVYIFVMIMNFKFLCTKQHTTTHTLIL